MFVWGCNLIMKFEWEYPFYNIVLVIVAWEMTTNLVVLNNTHLFATVLQVRNQQWSVWDPAQGIKRLNRGVGQLISYLEALEKSAFKFILVIRRINSFGL